MKKKIWINKLFKVFRVKYLLFLNICFKFPKVVDEIVWQVKSVALGGYPDKINLIAAIRCPRWCFEISAYA